MEDSVEEELERTNEAVELIQILNRLRELKQEGPQKGIHEKIRVVEEHLSQYNK